MCVCVCVCGRRNRGQGGGAIAPLTILPTQKFKIIKTTTYRSAVA